MSDADNEKKRGGVLNKEQHYVPYYPISFSLVETFLQHPIGSLGVFGTMSVLAGGLYSMLRGDSALKSNAMMRNRVLAQLATVGVVCGALVFFQSRKKGQAPKEAEKKE